MTEIIDGKAFAEALCLQLSDDIRDFTARYNITPCIAVVMVGDDPASSLYVNNKVKRCAQVGIKSLQYPLAASSSQQQLKDLIEQLNRDTQIQAILVQMPLPSHIDERVIINSIAVDKDVDGFHTENVGALMTGNKQMVPCTPLGIMLLLKRYRGELAGLHALVIGRSNIVGKPIASLLLQADCTVTITHSKTLNIEAICRQADIIIAATGSPKLVKSSWVKPGATVIDVGINRIQSGDRFKIVGDVDFDPVAEVAGAITPVPGGCGPMTIACLMSNTLVAAKRQLDLS